VFRQTVTEEYSAEHSGYRDKRNLMMLRRGCCPPMLSEILAKPWNPNVAKNDPTQAAISMLKARTYGLME